MKHSILHSLASLLGASLLLTSCSNEELKGDYGKKINLSVTASKSTLTRSSFDESEGDLICNWTDGDQLIVTGNNGNKLGVLNLTPDGNNSSVATFKGIIDYSGEESLNFIYPGTEGSTSIDNGSSPISIAIQDGTLDNLTNYDVLTATAKVSLFENGAVADIGTMNRTLAFGKFSLSGVELAAGDIISITGENVMTDATVNWSDLNATPVSTENNTITITKSESGNEIYVTIIPAGEKEITPTFTVTKQDGTVFTGSLDPRKWEASEFVRNYTNGENNSSGIKVNMTEVKPEQPANDDTVGPIIEIEGKKYKLMKGNLYFNTSERTWGVFENQLTFVNKNGKNTTDSGKAPSNSPEIIDLFGWGATGYQNARQPDYRNASDNYFPSNDVNNNWFSSLRGTQFDWGYVYEMQVKDGFSYLTPTSSEIVEICNNRYCRNATVLGIKGLLVFPEGYDDVFKATEWLDSYGESYIKAIANSNSNSRDDKNTFDKITIKSEENWTKMEEEGVIFFCAAGHSIGNADAYKDDVYYWSATGNQTNAIGILSRSGYIGSDLNIANSRGKRMASAVRLLKEVK